MKANNLEEAKQLVSDQWNNSEHILSAEDFTGADFKAKSAKRNRDYER